MGKKKREKPLRGLWEQFGEPALCPHCRNLEDWGAAYNAGRSLAEELNDMELEGFRQAFEQETRVRREIGE